MASSPSSLESGGLAPAAPGELSGDALGDALVDGSAVLAPSEEEIDGEHSSFELLLIKEQQTRSAAHEAALSRYDLSKSAAHPPFSPSRIESGTFTFGGTPPGSPSISVNKGSPDDLADLEVDSEQIAHISQSLQRCIERTHSRLYDAFLVMSRNMSKDSSGGLSRGELVEGLSQLNSGVELESLEAFAQSVRLGEDGLVGFQEFYHVFETERRNLNVVSWSPPRSGIRSSVDGVLSETPSSREHGGSEDGLFWGPSKTDHGEMSHFESPDSSLSRGSQKGLLVDDDDDAEIMQQTWSRESTGGNRENAEEAGASLAVSNLMGKPTTPPLVDESNDDEIDGIDNNDKHEEEDDGGGAEMSPKSNSSSTLLDRRRVGLQAVTTKRATAASKEQDADENADSVENASTPGNSFHSYSLGDAAPSIQAASDAVLDVRVHCAENLSAGHSSSNADNVTAYFSCRMGKDKFKTPIAEKSANPVWESAHSFGGPGKPAAMRLPHDATNANLVLVAKSVDRWSKRTTLGTLSIAIWSLLKCDRERPYVVASGNDSIEVKRWFRLTLPHEEVGVRAEGNSPGYETADCGAQRRSLFGFSFPGSPISSKAIIATSPPQSPAGIEPPASLPRVQLSLRLTFPGLDRARESMLGTEPLPPPIRSARSRNTSPASASSLDAQQRLISASVESAKAELRAEHSAALEAERRAHQQQVEEAVSSAVTAQRERGEDLRAELQLLRLQLDAEKESPTDNQSPKGLNDSRASLIESARRQAEGEAAIKRREELEINARLQAQQAHDYEELVFQLRAKITELRREHAEELDKSSRRNEELQRQVGELFQAVGSAEAALSVKEGAVLEHQKEVKEVAARERLQRSLKEDLEAKLKNALTLNDALQAKVDDEQTKVVNMVAAAGRRLQPGDCSPRSLAATAAPPVSESEEIKQLLGTISQLNSAFDVLRESERKAQKALSETNVRFHETSLEMSKLAAANESQAKELTRVVDELSKTSQKLSAAQNEGAALQRKVTALETGSARTDATRQLQARELASLRERNFKLEGQAAVLQQQISESNEKFLSISGEVVELRRYRAGSTAHLHAQSLVIERMKSGRKDSVALSVAIDGPCLQAKLDDTAAKLDGLREATLALKKPVQAFPAAVATAIVALNAFLALRKRQKGGVSLAFNKLLHEQRNTIVENAQQDTTATGAADPGTATTTAKVKRPLNLDDARKTFELERQRRRSLMKSKPKVLCSVYRKPGSSAALVSSSFSPTASEYQGNAARFDMVPGDGAVGSLQLEPLVESAELCVPGEGVDRFFAFDKVLVHDKPPLSAAAELSQHAQGKSGNASASVHCGGLREHIHPLVDGLFDGDKAVVVATGPGASTTTQSLVNAIFDAVEELGRRQNNGTSTVEPRVSISCVDVHGKDVFDMLANPAQGDGAGLGIGSPAPSDSNFGRLDFDRAAARATGRVNLEAVGLTIVEVRSRYEASLVTAMGSGNRAAVAASRNILDGADSASESHMLLGISVESVNPFTGSISAGKLRIVELSSSPAQNRQGHSDDSVDALAQVVTALSSEPDTKCRSESERARSITSARSPGALARLFSRGILLGLIRDCLDQEALGISPLSGTTFAHGAGSRLPDVGEGQNLFHLIVHASLILSNPRNADLLSALSFARRVRASGGASTNAELQDSAWADSPAPLLSLPVGSSFYGSPADHSTLAMSPAAGSAFSRSGHIERAEDRGGRRGPSHDVTSSPRPSQQSGTPRRQLFGDNGRGKSHRNAGPSTLMPKKPGKGNAPSAGRRNRTNTEATRAMTRVISALMDHTSEGMLHTLFLSMDTSHTGFLSRQQFRSGVHKIDPTLTKREVELFMNSMDAKSDGKIDFQEFFRTLGDAKTASNQPLVPVSDPQAYPIVIRERQRIRERLSPKNSRATSGQLIPKRLPLTLTTSQNSPRATKGGDSSSSGKKRASPASRAQSLRSPNGSASPSSASSSKAPVDYLLGWTPPVEFQASLRR